MRALVLTAVLGFALPAFGADDAAPPGVEATALEEVAPTSEPAQGEAAPTAEKEPVEAAATAEKEPAEAEPERPPVPPDAVARATFATAVDQREPVDTITSLGSDHDRVFFFTEFDGISGRRLTHRWEYRGEVMAEVPIAIGGPRWRAYSSKKLDASQLGEWTVSVVDESGDVVRKDSFVYEAAAPAAEAAAPVATPAVPAGGEAPDEAPASPPPAQP